MKYQEKVRMHQRIKRDLCLELQEEAEGVGEAKEEGQERQPAQIMLQYCHKKKQLSVQEINGPIKKVHLLLVILGLRNKKENKLLKIIIGITLNQMLLLIILLKQKIPLINQILDNSEDNFNPEMKIEAVVITLEVEEIIIKSSHQEINLKKKIHGPLNPLLKKIHGPSQTKKLKKMHGVNQMLRMKIATGILK
jgi:hypothetical protein